MANMSYNFSCFIHIIDLSTLSKKSLFFSSLNLQPAPLIIPFFVPIVKDFDKS